MFSRNPCIDTARWASHCLGETEIREDIESRDNKWNASVKNRFNVMPDEIRHGLPKANFNKDVIEGFADFPDEITRFRSRFRDAVVIDRRIADRPLLPVDRTEFKAFSRKDLARLGITLTDELNDIFDGERKRESKDGTTGKTIHSNNNRTNRLPRSLTDCSISEPVDAPEKTLDELEQSELQKKLSNRFEECNALDVGETEIF